MVEFVAAFADFNDGPMENPMTRTDSQLIGLLQKQDDGDLRRAPSPRRRFSY